MKTGILLQVRLDSSRLPGKALLPLGEKPVIRLAMEALSQVDADYRLLVTDAASSESLAPHAAKAGWGIFVGPRDDVLRRYALAVRETGIETVIRATGDNPLVSGELAASLLKAHVSGGFDYSGYLDIPLGTGVEAIHAAALIEANDRATDSYEREHVAPYLYRRPDHYRIGRPKAPEDCLFPGARVTLDTEEDYRYLQRLFAGLYRGKPVQAPALAAWLHDDSRRSPHVRDEQTDTLRPVGP